MALDFTTKRQVPDYRLDPAIYQILAQAIQNKNQMYGQLGQSLGQFGSGAVQGYQEKQKENKLKQMQQNLAQQNPQLAGVSPFITPENAGQFSGLMKPPKQNPEFDVVSGFLSPKGTLYRKDKYSGQIEDTGVPASPTGGSQMAGIREKQFGLQDLPSNQSPQTAGGAAYQVKVAARQGKNLIARPGSPQRTALATGDLARAILRNAPTDETLKNGNFSDNLVQRWSVLKQKLTADPTSVANPQIRREMYNIFDEMDKSATPFIKNQLDDMESMGFKIPKDVRKRQMGETLPDVPFIDIPTSSGIKNPNDLSSMSNDELRRIAGVK